MDAILRVDHEFGIAFLFADDLIDARRAITLCGLIIERQIIGDRDRRILELKVDRLIFLMVGVRRSEEHTSELQSLMRISYAVFCLKKKKINNNIYIQKHRLHTHTNTQAP